MDMPHPKLIRITPRVWYYPAEEERDRPVLGYVRGDRWSLAVDAGHSAAHTLEFYAALRDEGLLLPRLTVLTHWHWDHSFGLHAVDGLSLAGAPTDRHLRECVRLLSQEGPEAFLKLHESIRREYAGGQEMRVIPPDLTFEGEMNLDAGNCPIRVFQAPAPHTDDSVLILVREEKVLFLGDAVCGAFPTWEKDEERTRALARIIEASEADWCLEGHWVPETKENTIRELLGEEGA